MPTKKYTFGAGEVKHFGPGNEIRIIEADAEVDVKVFKNGTEINSETAEGVLAGLSIRPLRVPGEGFAFEDSTVESATAQTVKIFTTRGESRYDRGQGSVSIVSPASLVFSNVTAGAASGVVVAANSGRWRVRIKNIDGTETVYIRDDGGAATTSDHPIGPGEMELFHTRDGINAIRGGAVDVSLKVVEEQ